MAEPMTPRFGRVDLVGGAIAVGIALCMFGPALWSGLTLRGGDLVVWVPQFIQTFREGLFFPRWFPYYYAGLAQQFQFLSHAGFTMVLVPPFAFHAAQFTLDVAIASLGMWFLLRTWRLRLGACAVGAVAYPLSNHLLTWVQAGHLWKYDTTCWTPWLLLALWRAQDTGKLTWFAWAGAFLGLHLLGGDVQLAYYVGLVVATLTVARALNWYFGRGAEGRPPLALPTVGRQVIGHAMCVALAAGFGAEVIHHYAHLLATQEVVAGPTEVEQWRFATEFSLPPEETLALVAGGGIFGHSMDGPHYWGRARGRGTDDYLGVVALCFALCAVYVRRDRMALAWAGLALGALLLAYGRYLPAVYHTVYALPFMSALRNPNRWLFVTAWATSILAALGADAWLRADEAAQLRRRLAHVAVVLGGIGVMALGVVAWQRVAPIWWRDGLYATLGGRQATVEEVEFRFGVLHAEAFRAALLFIAWALLTGARWLGRPTRPRVGTGLLGACGVLLVGADLGTHAQPFIRTYDAATTFARTPFMEALRSPPLGGRVKLWEESPALRRAVTHQFPYFGVPTLDVISSRRPPEYTTILDAWRRGDLPTGRVLQLFHVTTLVSAQPLPPGAPPHDPVGVFGDAYVAAVRNPTPRAQVVGDFNVIGEAAILRRMTEPDFDPAAEILLEERPPVRLAVFDRPAEGTAQLQHESPHRLVFSVSASRDAMLLVHDLYDRYWQATVNGERVPVLRADGFLRAVPLARGTDMRVEMWYAPPRWPWALTLGGWLALAGGAGAAAARWWRRGGARAAQEAA